MFGFLLVFLSITILGIINRAYIKLWHKKLKISLNFDKDSYFEGEEGKIIEGFENNKIIPIWFLGLLYPMTRNLQFEENEAYDREYFKKDVTSILPYESLKKTIDFKAVKRGYHVIYQYEISTGDIFVKDKFIIKNKIFKEVYIYPLLRNNEEAEEELKSITGEVVNKNHFIEDPFEFRGIRDYYPFDSMKNINWNASAKSIELKVNQYNFSQSKKVFILLNLDKFNSWDDGILTEETIRCAAFMTGMLINRGIKVGFMSNGKDIITKAEMVIPSSDGMEHFHRILRSLARIDENLSMRNFKQVFDGGLIKGETPLLIMFSHHFGLETENFAREIMIKDKDFQWVIIKKKEERIKEFQGINARIVEVKY